MSVVLRLAASRCSPLALSKRSTARPGIAHGLQDVGVAGVRIGDRVARDRRPDASRVSAASCTSVTTRQQRQHHRAARASACRASDAAARRRRGRSASRAGRTARPVPGCQEAAQRVDVAAALRAPRRSRSRSAACRCHLVRERCKLRVEPRAETDQDLRADDVEHALEQVEPDRQNRERDAASAGCRW